MTVLRGILLAMVLVVSVSCRDLVQPGTPVFSPGAQGVILMPDGTPAVVQLTLHDGPDHEAPILWEGETDPLGGFVTDLVPARSYFVRSGRDSRRHLPQGLVAEFFFPVDDVAVVEFEVNSVSGSLDWTPGSPLEPAGSEIETTFQGETFFDFVRTEVDSTGAFELWLPPGTDPLEIRVFQQDEQNLVNLRHTWNGPDVVPDGGALNFSLSLAPAQVSLTMAGVSPPPGAIELSLAAIEADAVFTFQNVRETGTKVWGFEGSNRMTVMSRADLPIVSQSREIELGALGSTAAVELGLYAVSFIVQRDGIEVPDVLVSVVESRTVNSGRFVTDEDGRAEVYLNRGSYSVQIREAGGLAELRTTLFISGPASHVFDLLPSP